MISSNLVGRTLHATFSTMAHNMDALRTYLSKVLLMLGLEQICARIHNYASMVFHLGKLWKVKH